MCVVTEAMVGSAAAAMTANIAIASVGATVAMSAVQMQQAASQAQANLDFQGRQQRQQVEQNRQTQLLQAQQQRQSLALQAKQADDARFLQISQANAQIANQYNQQRAAVIAERATIMQRHEANKLTYQRSVEQAREQIGLNNEAANRAYQSEQTKLDEARKKAAFEQQAILARSIGDKGAILAAGRTGQSVGLLVNDVERQKGFSEAQINATLDSKRDQAILSMEGNWLQNQSANAQALGNIAFNPQSPYLPSDPKQPRFVRDPVGLAIDSPFATA
tara:strand:- start:637 stop:1467 length:831 start_codon:yes stop_codon:yes gene_type:complete